MTGFLDAVCQVDGAEYVSGEANRFLVVRLSPAAFEQLSSRYSERLIIEPDAPLSL